jgi:hypothetical protein
MIEKRGNRWCVVHGHPQKAGSERDKPKGAVIKCFPFTPGDKESEASARLKANAMHKAILASQAEQKE